MQAVTRLQAVGDRDASTATESGLIKAQEVLKPTSQGGQGREFSNKVVVLLTDGVPNVTSSPTGTISSYMSANPDSNFYGGGYWWLDGPIMQAKTMTSKQYQTYRSALVWERITTSWIAWPALERRPTRRDRAHVAQATRPSTRRVSNRFSKTSSRTRVSDWSSDLWDDVELNTRDGASFSAKAPSTHKCSSMQRDRTRMRQTRMIIALMMIAFSTLSWSQENDPEWREYVSIGDEHLKRSEFRMAEENFLEAHRLAKQFEPNDPRRAYTAVKIADIYMRDDRRAKARTLYEKAAEVFTSMEDDGLEHLAYCEKQLGDLDSFEGQPQKAIERYAKTIRILEVLERTKDANLVAALFGIARAERLIGRLPQSEKAFQTLLERIRGLEQTPRTWAKSLPSTPISNGKKEIW